MRAHRVALVLAAVAIAASAQTTPPKSEDETGLYIQTAASGTFEPNAKRPGHYTLTLEGVSPLTITLPDRPGTRAGEVPTDRFQRTLKRDDKNPPRAAIEVADAPKDADVVVVELRDPVYDASKRSAKYDVTVSKTPRKRLANYGDRMDAKLPRKFGAASMTVDENDCEDGPLVLRCITKGLDAKDCGWIVYRYCYDRDSKTCDYCPYSGRPGADPCGTTHPSCCKPWACWAVQMSFE